jgi:L-ascorbate metabolism protein UlaG (beta-lactamase superfamily)
MGIVSRRIAVLYYIYIGGDSGYGKHYKEIGERFPNIDLALLENGQYNIKWQYIHLMPHLMPKAAKELGARRFITGHHLKFTLSEHSWNEPYKNIEAMRAEGLDVIDPKIGEIVELK